ncbi:MAG: bifunctional UDP-sugar hydrolase/5'-nucleotidase [Candidatus Ozemobacteraceae bacterium]
MILPDSLRVDSLVSCTTSFSRGKGARTSFAWRLGLVFCIVVFFGTAALYAANNRCPNASEAIEFTILHTSDTHSHLMAFDCASGTGIGGYARLKAYKEGLEREGRTVCLLSSGDVFQGTLFFRFFRGIPDVAFMNAMGYAAMAVGNHEFDAGQDGMTEAFKNASFPVLSANLLFGAKPELGSLVKPAAIVPVKTKKGVVKLGIIGLTDENLMEDCPKAFLKGITVDNASNAIARELPKLKAAGADLVIGLCHLGYNREVALINSIPALDGVLGGHSHLFIDPPVVTEGEHGQRFIAQPGENGIAVTRLDLRFTPGCASSPVSGGARDAQDKHEGGRLEVVAAGLISLSKELPEDAEIKSTVDKLWQQVKNKVDIVLATTSGRIDGDKPQIRRRETTMGNLVADAYVTAIPADFGVINGGGVRASIMGPSITIGDCLNVQPFDNYLTRVELRGATVLKLFEQVRQGLMTQLGYGGFLQISHDLHVAYGLDGVKVTLAGKPIDPDAVYSITTNDFLAAGGNGLTAFCDSVASQPSDILGADAFMRHLKAHEMIEPALEGRIIVDVTVAGMMPIWAMPLRVPRPR